MIRPIILHYGGSKMNENEQEYELPVGMAEFETWAARIIEKAGKFADDDSMKFALASQIMHLDAKKSTYADSVFVAMLRKAAANQVASQVFQDIKLKQMEAQKAAEEKAKQEAEATAAAGTVDESTSKEA